MADVYIVTFSVIGILLTFPGLAAALNLLLPRVTESAYLRLARTPVKSFALGLPVAAGFTVWILITANVNFGPAKALAALAALIGLGVATLGAAGMARLLGERIEALTDTGTVLTNMLRGAVIVELASLFPIIGWFLFLPWLLITIMGAAIFGILGWVPRPKDTPRQGNDRTLHPTETAAFAPLEVPR